MKTIGQIIHQKEFPLTFDNDKENRIYFENDGGFWTRRKYASNNEDVIYFEDSNRFIKEIEYIMKIHREL